MTLIDLKGHLLTRRANLEAQLLERRKTVLCIESDLIRARREADMTEGAMADAAQGLADVEQAIQAAAAAPSGERGAEARPSAGTSSRGSTAAK